VSARATVPSSPDDLPAHVVAVPAVGRRLHVHQHAALGAQDDEQRVLEIGAVPAAPRREDRGAGEVLVEQPAHDVEVVTALSVMAISRT
jgi:hypothetical protein